MSDKPLPRLSAHALSELGRCERKFALVYREQTFWPGVAPEGAGDPLALRLGQAFHLLVQVQAQGLDVAGPLAALADEGGKLEALWRAFSQTPHLAPVGRVWTEQQLNFFIAGVPFQVRYDRLVHEPGQWTILDWKTGRLDAKLASSWQSRLYRYALVEAGAALGLGAIAPEEVGLVYHEVASGRTLALGYDLAAHAATGRELLALAERVKRPFNPRLADDEHYPRTASHCPRCSFHTLCNRELATAVARVELVPAPRFAEELA